MDSSDLIVGGMLAGAFIVCLVTICAGFLQSRQMRLLTHQERMKALELGREMPVDAVRASKVENKSESLPRKCFSTAFWVGFAGFVAAASQGFTPTATLGIASHGIAIAIAASTGAIGVTALICGTILAARTPSAPARRVASNKPEIDSDAVDVVSSRG
jgi:hypothetical protein